MIMVLLCSCVADTLHLGAQIWNSKVHRLHRVWSTVEWDEPRLY
jgi:hypothetical protein